MSPDLPSRPPDDDPPAAQAKPRLRDFDVTLLPEVTSDEFRRPDDDDRRFLDEVPPHHVG